MPISNKARWVGVAPTDPAEVIPVSDKRLMANWSELLSYSLPAGSSYDWLSVSGAGAILATYHHSTGVLPDEAVHIAIVDGVSPPSLYTIGDIDTADLLGRTSGGVYQDGSAAMFVEIWDTGSNEYKIHRYNLRIPFQNSLTLRIRNDSGTASATVSVGTLYGVYTASRALGWVVNDLARPKPREIHRMINKDIFPVDAVILDHGPIRVDVTSKKVVHGQRLLVICGDYVADHLKGKVEERMIKENLIKEAIHDLFLPGNNSEKYASKQSV